MMQTFERYAFMFEFIKGIDYVLFHLPKEIKTMAATVQDIQNTAANLTVKVQEVVARIELLRTELANAIANQADPTVLQSINDQLEGAQVTLQSALDAANP